MYVQFVDGVTEHKAVVPPFDPIQPHVHGPIPLTAVAVPPLQRFVVGAVVDVCPFDAPQVPLTGVAENIADTMQLAVTGFVV